MSDVRCKTCRFFVTGQVMGACRRFPEMQNKHEMDWCGEHQIKMVALAVYDIMTDETKVAEVPAAVAPQPKKPGRKPKNANSPAA
jgi:hypothetical protein